MSDRDVSSVEGHYEHGLELGARGEWFEAHEAFELAWRACAAEERDFFQGLVHVVVSSYQRERGKPVAAESQRVKALRRLAPYVPRHRGIDVESLRDALERSEPDLREHLVQAVA
jgi:predicted metal-dependent hydrolase